jgi:hypothetical protein
MNPDHRMMDWASYAAINGRYWELGGREPKFVGIPWDA